MTKRDMDTLARRADRTASALNFIGVLASSNAMQALRLKSSRRQVQTQCSRAVGLCIEMARGISGASVDPASAKDHLERLEEALARDDLVGTQHHAAAALRALGFGRPTERKQPAATPKSRVTRAAAATRRMRKSKR